jgi:hypothetical protein
MTRVYDPHNAFLLMKQALGGGMHACKPFPTSDVSFLSAYFPILFCSMLFEAMPAILLASFLKRPFPTNHSITCRDHALLPVPVSTI